MISRNKKNILCFLFAGLSGFLFTGNLQAQNFGIDVNYEEAVPNFLDSITDETAQVKDDAELSDIEQWHEDSEAELPQFLDDLTAIAQSLENNGNPQFAFDQYAAFAEQWNQIAENYPGIEELDPILSPLIDQLLVGLPTIEPVENGVPLESLFDLYNEMAVADPWGLGAFFQLEPLPTEAKETQIFEISRELTVKGVKKVHIIQRGTRIIVNGVIVFFELIIDDTVVSKFVRFRDPTLIHEILTQMKINTEDPLVIQALEEMVELIDFHLQQALDNNILDECSYNFIYRKELAAGTENCTDIMGEQQEFMKIVQHDPFDQINQLELSFASDMNENPQLPGQLSISLPEEYYAKDLQIEAPQTEVLTNYQSGLEGAAPIWFTGVVIPAYLLSLVGFFRIF